MSYIMLILKKMLQMFYSWLPLGVIKTSTLKELLTTRQHLIQDFTDFHVSFKPRCWLTERHSLPVMCILQRKRKKEKRCEYIHGYGDGMSMNCARCTWSESHSFVLSICCLYIYLARCMYISIFTYNVTIPVYKYATNIVYYK